MGQRTSRLICGLLLGSLLASSCTYFARVTLDSSGAEILSDSAILDVSADGRYVLFVTRATLDPVLDTNSPGEDLYRKDLLTGAVVMVTPGANDFTTSGQMSDDGNIVAFTSRATNLVAGDTNGANDVFVRDIGAALTVRASLRADGSQSTSGANDAAISGNGQFVAWHTSDPIVATDTNATRDVYRYNRQNGGVVHISRSSGGMIGDGQSRTPSLSYNGAAIAFESGATNLVPGDTNGRQDVFVWLNGIVVRASVDATNGQADGVSRTAAISGNGLVVAFGSTATNLVPGDTNGTQDVFVKAITGAIERASVNDDGSQAGFSSDPWMNHDGTLVAFWLGGDAAVRDGVAETTTMLHAPNGQRIQLDYAPIVMSADGVYVAVSSEASLTAGETTEIDDGYLVWWSDAEIDSVTPFELETGTTTVTIDGSGFNRLADYDVYTNRAGEPGVTFSNVTVVDSETITFDATVAANAPSNLRTLWLEGLGQGPGVTSGSLDGCVDCVHIQEVS